MPTLVDIVTNLVSTMRAVPSAGAGHPRARSARTPEQIARLCAFEPDGYRGWVIQYLFSTEKDGRKLNTVERLLRFRLWLVLPYDDDRTDGDTSTDQFNAMFEDMATRLREDRSLGYCRADVEHGLLQVEGEPAPVELAQAKGTAHVGRCRLDIRTFETVRAC